MVGGKGQKRKRTKKEAVKAPRKKRKGTPWQQTNKGRVKSDSYALVCFWTSVPSRTKEANACTRRGRPQSSEDDDQTEGDLVRSGGLAHDALQGGVPSAQQQGEHTQMHEASSSDAELNSVTINVTMVGDSQAPSQWDFQLD